MAVVSAWLLWCQAGYTIWQFVRVAKYFRMPFAIFYTIIGFFFQYGPFPFAKKKVCYIKNGVKRPSATDLETNSGDRHRNGCNIVERRPKCYVAPGKTLSYALKDSDYVHLRTIDVKDPYMFCSERDLLGGNLYIINKLEYGEALETYLKPEYKEEVLEMRVLVYPSEELNKNLMRLFSIIPLLLQASDMMPVSITFSILIILIDLFSNILEKRCWIPIKVMLKDFIRGKVSKVKSRSLRSSLSKYLSSISLSLLHSDSFTCNFKKVDSGERVWVMPNTYLDGFKNYVHAPIRKFEMVLEEEDIRFIKSHNKGQKKVGREKYFSIRKGSKKYSVNTKQGMLKCVFVPRPDDGGGMAYNFLNDAELHWGPYAQTCTPRIISFLNEIAKLDYLPFTMSIKNNTYQLEGYDRVFHHVAIGGWFMIAEAIHKGFVA